MNTKKKVYLLLAGMAVFPIRNYALTSRFTIDLAVFGQIFASPNGTFTLQPVDGRAVQVGQGSNACLSVDQINITPPSAQRGEWVSIILQAWVSRKPILITGDCSGSQITATSTSTITGVFQ